MIAALVALAIAPSQFVALDQVDATIVQDMRYTTKYNFVGRRIDGYREPVCILTRPAARALHRAQQRLKPKGYGLKVYDCYRPTRAVAHFDRWARDTDDQRMKREFYPRVDKARAFVDGYIAHRSGHSRGSTVDITLVKLPAQPQPRWDGRFRSCIAPYRRRFADTSVNMGTSYDCMDPRAATFHPGDQGPPAAQPAAAQARARTGGLRVLLQGVVALHIARASLILRGTSISPSTVNR